MTLPESFFGIQIVDSHLLTVLNEQETGATVPTVYRMIPGFDYP